MSGQKTKSKTSEDEGSEHNKKRGREALCNLCVNECRPLSLPCPLLMFLIHTKVTETYWNLVEPIIIASGISHCEA